MPALHLFDAYGIELEYMIVDAHSLDVRPASDVILRDADGRPVSDLEFGPISWSNELTHHVIELKTTAPTESLAELPGQFEKNVRQINRQLAPGGYRLLPTAVHPWMNPAQEMQLWPHEYHAVYEVFNRIFDCRGHGWANLQSMHVNLPFRGDDEFGRLHAAIRLILPILPALAASSPFLNGQRTGLLDSRLNEYRLNARRIPSVTGRVIPEPVYTEAHYGEHIFQPMFRDIAEHDPEGILQDEFLNARGAIARFSRGAIEIRVIDVQECPQADVAIAALTVAALQALVGERWSDLTSQQTVAIDTLEPILIETIRSADQAILSDRDYLRHWGIDEAPITAGELWNQLLSSLEGGHPDLQRDHHQALQVILSEGCLARRIDRAVGDCLSPVTLRTVYRQLADCLEQGRMFQVNG